MHKIPMTLDALLGSEGVTVFKFGHGALAFDFRGRNAEDALYILRVFPELLY